MKLTTTRDPGLSLWQGTPLKEKLFPQNASAEYLDNASGNAVIAY